MVGAGEVLDSHTSATPTAVNIERQYACFHELSQLR